MMKTASTPSIVAICVFGSLAVLPMGCHDDKVAIGQQNSGGQVADANPAAGGQADSGEATGAGGGAGGAGTAGGSATTGGATGAGGAVGAGGASATGGNAKNDGAAGSGGVIGAGGAADGGCAPGWTMCCGQCLSPQAGICAPCLGTGGTGQTGGGTGTGGGGAGGSGAGGASGTCSSLTTQAACDSRGDCHSVFIDANDCGCALAGCCTHFNRCADGGRANCTGPVSCSAPQPICNPPYVHSYTSTCYEGCVLQSECVSVDAGA